MTHVTRVRLAVVLALAALPAARLGLDAVADSALGGELLLTGLALLGLIAVIGVGAIDRLDRRWRAPTALACAAAAGALAIVEPYDERTPGFVVFSILLFACALRFATQPTGRQADALRRAARGARAAATTTWLLAALGLAAGVVVVVVTLLLPFIVYGS